MDKALLDIADKENIIVNYDNLLPRFKALALYDNDGYGAQIILHEGLRHNPRLLRCIFAEELGHHFTTAGPSFYKPASFQFWKLNYTKVETKALKWSAYELVPDKTLTTLIDQGLQTCWELAEECDITTELALFRMKLHLQKHPFRKELLSEAQGKMRLSDDW